MGEGLLEGASPEIEGTLFLSEGGTLWFHFVWQSVRRGRVYNRGVREGKES
jgi:hypothetical protein